MDLMELLDDQRHQSRLYRYNGNLVGPIVKVIPKCYESNGAFCLQPSEKAPPRMLSIRNT